MGGKYVTRYFEENAKKYGESPDKTGRFDGAGLGGGMRQGGRESSDFCTGMFEAGGKNRGGPDGSTTRCGACIG
ncbi:hypothetical protein NUV26_33185 [Burkholderia pseudomultivorans]|uniref:hypothetical protein n=1 Tax=Burkholderia pseudomultivorans TaxID=1207504 RepID=UPI000A9E80F0|nr:hypothetical protein [Burkholderia pseudomultivorans]MDS0797021.1 hypothetical protein [Burkholderia pseudomultivorans]